MPRSRHDPTLGLFKTDLLIPEADMLAVVRRMHRRLDLKVLFVLDYIGKEVVRFLRDYTTELRPDDPRAVWSTGPRPAHPGHWADITRDLRKKYAYEVVTVKEGEHLLVLKNQSEHAAYVEAMEGFYVIRGVLARGSPVHKALHQIMLRLDADEVLKYGGMRLGTKFRVFETGGSADGGG